MEPGFFPNEAKSIPHNFFLFFLFLVLCVIKKIFLKKYGVTDLVFKIDAIDGKKWVKYVAMQQNSETLIYDVNSVEGIKQYSSKPEKLHLVRKVFQRKP